MKKICVLLVIAMILGSFSVFADGGGTVNRVEIAFAVGDSILSINGQEVEVVTPYVVDGVTLVPVRVISESFGAEVQWDEKTQTATVIYGDAVIELTIGSKIAKVNGNEEELLAAPELKDGRTMLPLRFITEAFGADVSYDEKTEKILVIKEITDSNSIMDYASILKHSSKEYVGDSYYKWSMKRTPELMLKERSFDGFSSCFVSSTRGVHIDVEIGLVSADYTIDDIYEAMRKFAADYTLIDLKKSKTSSGVEYVYVKVKSKDYYLDTRAYIKDGKMYTTWADVSVNEGLSVFNEICAVVDTFDLKFDSSKAEDLSDVTESGLRIFNSKDMAVKMAIPANYVDNCDEETVNVFYFDDYDAKLNYASSVHVSVYSSEPNLNYETWAKQDLESNKKTFNPKYVKFSEMQKATIAGKDAVFYTYTIEYNGSVTKAKDIFIDAGDYFYNVSISLMDQKNSDTLMKTLTDSISIGTIDKSKIGQLTRIENGDIKYKTQKNSLYGYSIDLPSTWEFENTTDGATIAGYGPQFILVSPVSISGPKMSSAEFKSSAQGMYDQYRNNKSLKMVSKSMETTKIAGEPAYYFTFTEYNEDYNETMVCTIYITFKNNTVYIIGTYCEELYYGSEITDMFNTMISSFKMP